MTLHQISNSLASASGQLAVRCHMHRCRGSEARTNPQPCLYGLPYCVVTKQGRQLATTLLSWRDDAAHLVHSRHNAEQRIRAQHHDTAGAL